MGKSSPFHHQAPPYATIHHHVNPLRTTALPCGTTNPTGIAGARWHQDSRVVDHQGMRPADPDRFSDAYEVLARAKEEAEQIRRDALVTAEGIRRIAIEDARELRLPGAVDEAEVDAGRVELEARVERLERKVKRQRRQIERLEAVLLGLAPGLGRRKKR